MKKLAFIILILLPLAGNSYNIKNHKLITQRAIELLNKLYGANYITPYQANQIISGNLSEDRLNPKWIVRPFNWHFYNPLKEKQYWKRWQSIDKRFEKLQGRFNNRINKDKFYFSIGEIIHHLQDETNPAHVVPVYHGGIKKDMFDEQPISNLLPENINEAEIFNFNSEYPLQLLRATAIQTLNNISQKFTAAVIESNEKLRVETIDWSYFWKGNPIGWMGKYGIFGNHYLQDTILLNDEKYVINKHIYDDFSRQQLNLAVACTAKFIRYAKELNKK